MKRMGIAIAIAAVFLSVNAFESASAQRLVLDGISPQSDGTSQPFFVGTAKRTTTR